MNDIFFDTRNFSYIKKRNILMTAKSLCYDWWVDIKGNETKYYRKKIEMSFSEVMKKFNPDCHFSIIHRWIDFTTQKPYLEIGFCTLTEPEYFLCLYLDESHLPYFIKTYNLKPWN
jgi:hypothetical protein